MYNNGEIEKVMAMFEKTYNGRKDREESKMLWKNQRAFYQNGEANHAFNQFLNGYSYAKSLAIQGEWNEIAI